MKKMKLFPKTFIYTFCMLLVINLSLHLMIYFFYPKVYLERMEQNMETQISELQEQLQRSAEGESGKTLLNFAKENQLNITVETTEGEKTYQGMGFQISFPSEEDMIFSVGNMENTPSVIVKNRVLETEDGTEIKAQFMSSAKPLKEATDMIEFLLPVTFAVTVLFSVIFAWFYSKKITNPMVKMLKVTTDMKNRKPDAVFQVQTGDEMGMLAEQINEVYGCLLQTIQQLDEEKERMLDMEKSKTVFLRSASHELKTPLAGLRILLENMQYRIGKYKDRDRYLPEAIDMVDQLNDMVKQILDTSKMQEKMNGEEKEEIQVKKMTEEILQKFQMQIAEKQLKIIVKPDRNTTVLMGRENFRQVWSNLISNAVRYTEKEGMIKIGATGTQIWIENTCKPLPKEQLQYISEPFYRADATRNQRGGSGLGLYVVTQILKKEGLDWKFEPMEEGMRFTMEEKVEDCNQSVL